MSHVEHGLTSVAPTLPLQWAQSCLPALGSRFGLLTSGLQLVSLHPLLSSQRQDGWLILHRSLVTVGEGMGVGQLPSTSGTWWEQTFPGCCPWRPPWCATGRDSLACLLGPDLWLPCFTCSVVIPCPLLTGRKSKAKPNGKKPAAEEKKMYLEPEYTKSRITDFEFKELVVLPREIDLNEWLASNSACGRVSPCMADGSGARGGVGAPQLLQVAGKQ